MSDNEQEIVRRNAYQAQIEQYKTLWENTKNPLYVWEAINLCFAYHYIPEFQRTGEISSSVWAQPQTLPDWCISYIALVAFRMSALKGRKDFCHFPAPIGTAEPTRNAWRKAFRTAGDLNTKEVSGRVLWALGIRRDSGNAFNDHANLEKKEQELFRFLASRLYWNSPSDAMDAHLDAYSEMPKGFDLTIGQVDKATGLTDVIVTATEDESVEARNAETVLKRVRDVQKAYGVKPRSGRPRKAKPPP